MKRAAALLLSLCVILCFVSGCASDESYDENALAVLNEAASAVPAPSISELAKSGYYSLKPYFNTDNMKAAEEKYGYKLYFAGLYSDNLIARYYSMNKIAEFYGDKGADRAQYQLQRHTYDSNANMARVAMAEYPLFSGTEYSQDIKDKGYVFQSASGDTTVLRLFADMGGCDKLLVVSGKKSEIISFSEISEFETEKDIRVTGVAVSDNGKYLFVNISDGGYGDYALIDISSKNINVYSLKKYLSGSEEKGFDVSGSITLCGFTENGAKLNYSLSGNYGTTAEINISDTGYETVK